MLQRGAATAPDEPTTAREEPLPSEPGSAPRAGLLPRLAYAGLIALSLLTVTVRPVTELLHLPHALVNLDAVLVPPLAAVALALSLRTWRTTGRFGRALTVVVLVACAAAASSWVLGSPHNWAGFGLAYSSVLLFPLALYVAFHAARHVGGRADVMALRVMVLLQIVVCLVQYVENDVAAKAPFAADLVDGTTSHNFWPAFAMPAALVLALVERHRYRYLWLVSVSILAVYSEAKTALLLWLPAALALLPLAALVRARAARRTRREPRPVTAERLSEWAVGVAAVAVIAAGLVWNPSVQGTWDVFVGHANEIEQFSAGKETPETAGYPTLRDAATAVREGTTESPTSFLFGLGPGNSVSHAAQVLAQGPASGVGLPAPSDLAVQLVGRESRLQFEDAQSSLLGLWGDLGATGTLAYAGALALAVLGLLGTVRRSALRLPLRAAVLVLAGGVVAVGLPLDWQEQAGVVLPLALSIVVACRTRDPQPAATVAVAGASGEPGENHPGPR
ncbi:hypothetical protein [Motilibacter aurantiacus]|uniref:hypothetical protein n=1 Tax=Motilibacter aurantiacus TaxID=2714955 RepID=UPI00140C3EFF|nr:hypothetical protein [Motilibacter aurantiacus]NHC46351.1 hypothetical protein [Motilibacter aurantiacus]